MRPMRWEHCTSLAAGGWLVSSSWMFRGGDPSFAPAVNAVVVTGGALTIFAVATRVLRLPWGGWATLLLSAWALLAVRLLERTPTATPLIFDRRGHARSVCLGNPEP
jgi:hypothetical protein